MSILLRSKAFWSALIAFVGVVIMRFTQVPPEIWQSFVGLASAVVLAFLGDEVGVSLGKSMAKSLLEFKEAEAEAKEVEEQLKLQEFKG